MLLDESAKERKGVSGLDGRVLIWIVKGVGLSPTWHHSFPWIIWMFRNNIIIPLYIYGVSVHKSQWFIRVKFNNM